MIEAGQVTPDQAAKARADMIPALRAEQAAAKEAQQSQ